MMDMDKLAECILAARLNGKMPAPTDQWVGSADIDSAYNVQRTLLGEIARREGTVIGRKVGCTNQSARDLLGLDGPFHGALLSDTTMASPARIKRSDYPFIVLEPEFALKLGKPLEPEMRRMQPRACRRCRRRGPSGTGNCFLLSSGLDPCRASPLDCR